MIPQYFLSVKPKRAGRSPTPTRYAPNKQKRKQNNLLPLKICLSTAATSYRATHPLVLVAEPASRHAIANGRIPGRAQGPPLQFFCWMCKAVTNRAVPGRSNDLHRTKVTLKSPGTARSGYPPIGASSRTSQQARHCQRVHTREGARPSATVFCWMCKAVTNRAVPGRSNDLHRTKVTPLPAGASRLSTYRPGLRRLPWQRQQRDRACPQPETRWSARRQRWMLRSPGKNG